jgi:arylsulfatase B/arylsulfatase I/J
MEDHWSHGIHANAGGERAAGIFGIDIHNDTQGQPIVPPGPAHTSPYNCTHSSVLYGGEAARIISQHDATAPLYLYLALQSAHCPDQAPQALIDQFSEVVHYGRRVMCGMVVTLDNAVGEMLDALHQKGMYGNTLIIFHSDNGGELNNAGSNLPMRGGKFTYWEGGTYATVLGIRAPRNFSRGPRNYSPCNSLNGIFQVVVREICLGPR